MIHGPCPCSAPDPLLLAPAPLLLAPPPAPWPPRARPSMDLSPTGARDGGADLGSTTTTPREELHGTTTTGGSMGGSPQDLLARPSLHLDEEELDAAAAQELLTRTRRPVELVPRPHLLAITPPRADWRSLIRGHTSSCGPVGARISGRAPTSDALLPYHTMVMQRVHRDLSFWPALVGASRAP